MQKIRKKENQLKHQIMIIKLIQLNFKINFKFQETKRKTV
jgi:hypothetical protein